jgi:glucokinase
VREAIGIDVGGTKILGARLAEGGEILGAERVASDTRSADAVKQQIVALAKHLGAAPDVPVGVGYPGTVDQHRGAVVHAVNLPYDDHPLRSELADRLGTRVEVDNDANCAALAELRHGAGRGYRYLVMLTLGTGVGGGVVIDGRPYRGARGTGAELGHIVIVNGGRRCQGTCPGRGHLEAYASGRAADRQARRLGLPHADALLDAVKANDPRATTAVHRIAGALGAGLVTLANAFNPEIVVIGGGFGLAAAGYLLPPAAAILAGEALHPNGEIPVVTASLGESAGVIGAAELTR